MRTYAIDEDHETYARTGLGIDDIQVRLKLKHNIALGRNAIKCLVLRVPK